MECSVGQDFQEFYNALLLGLPNHRTGPSGSLLSFARVADDLGISRQAVRAWFVTGHISLKSLRRLTKLPGSTLTLEALAEALSK